MSILVKKCKIFYMHDKELEIISLHMAIENSSWRAKIGDNEINPGPKKSPRLIFCHWNLNGTAAHDFVMVHLI